MRKPTRASLFPFFAAAGLALFAVPGIHAWEWAYGGTPTSDIGSRRVAPVVHCPGGGYIAIGSQQGAGLDDVYVVRTDNAGVAIWEASYDIQGTGVVDEGMALAELPASAGFVLLSNTRTGVWMPALTQITCTGNVVWSRIYPDMSGSDLRSADLVLAATGDPVFLTAPGDLLVAGESFNGANFDAFLMRTNAGGIPIWNWAYDNSNTWGPARDGFAALTEAAPFGTQLTGDLVAVGRYVDLTTVDRQGLAARVDGNTGIIGAAPQCMAQHGINTSDELYFSVARLVTPPFAGQFAMVGATTRLGTWADDVWVTRGTPCFQMAQVRIGQSAGITTEAGRDLREVLSPIGGGAVVGDLAITGYHGPTGGGSRDAFLLLVQAGTLAPIFGNLYGDHALNNEIGVSLAQIPAGGPPGFILAGTTPTDWASSGDPSDLYLVNTDNAGRSHCEIPWLPNPVPLNWGSVMLTPSLRNPAQNFPIGTVRLPASAPYLVCA